MATKKDVDQVQSSELPGRSVTELERDYRAQLRAQNRRHGEITDAFTGEVRPARSFNHYEANDGVPVAPRVDVARPTVRQRIENLLNRGYDPLAHYVGTEGIDMEVPDDPEAPLTASEQTYIDTIAGDLAEQAPLPDDGMPRNPPGEPAQAPQPAPAPSPAASSVAAPAATGASAASGPTAPVPTR